MVHQSAKTSQTLDDQDKPSSLRSASQRIEDPYSRSSDDAVPPPRGIRATLLQLGPGMILAGSIVGSGELIMTTKLGAVAGFTFLWFVLLSCFIKVIVQAEIARHTISSGKTFLQVFNELPGPAGPRPVWLTLPWMAFVALTSVGALIGFMQIEEAFQTLPIACGFIGGVVALSTGLAWVITKRAAKRPSHSAESSGHNERPVINWFMWLWLSFLLLGFINAGAILGGAGQALEMAIPNLFGEGGARYWAAIIAVIVGCILLSGTYGSLEKTLIGLVATFTVLTLVCTVLLQWTDYAISWNDLKQGLSFGIPSELTSTVALTALAMYAATGVAYGEMWTYTYWCVEKGYARNVGPPQAGEEWTRRARGWIRVMYIDVFLTMVVYTVSTICFYLLGAAVLYVKNLNPDGQQTLATLAAMYTETMATWAATLFVVGGFCVLFTTVVAGVAGNARLMSDALGVMGIIGSRDYKARMKYIRIFVVVWLILLVIAYFLFENPPTMLAVTSSIIAAVMYPVLGIGVLYLRHHKVDSRIVPGKLTTSWLWICGIILAVVSPLGILLTLAIKFFSTD